jgi:hypothetical protein
VWVAQWLVVPGSRVRPDIETLRRLYVDERLSLATMAARLGVAGQTVHNWLVAGGVPRRASPARVRSDIDDGEIIRLYTHERHTAAEIAERLGCSASLVYARLARGGVDRRPQAPRGRAGPTARELGHLYGDCGLSLRDLAGHYLVTTRAVRGWLVTADIERRLAGSIVTVTSWSRCMGPGGRRPRSRTTWAAHHRRSIGASTPPASLGVHPVGR